MKSDFLKKLFFYVLIGVVGVIVDISVSNVFFNLIFKPIFDSANPTNMLNAESIAATIAAVIGGIAGFTNNFLLNEFLVYKKKGSKKIVLTRFSKYIVTIILGTFIIGKLLVFNLFFSGFGLGFTTSNLIAIGVGTLINYPINYFWTWGDFSVKKHIKRDKQD